MYYVYKHTITFVITSPMAILDSGSVKGFPPLLPEPPPLLAPLTPRTPAKSPALPLRTLNTTKPEGAPA